MNIKAKIQNLIIAVNLIGRCYKLNSEQYYSEKQDKICTKYILWEEYPKRDGIVFYSQIDLLKFLANDYKMLHKVGGSSG